MTYGYNVYFTERQKNRVACWSPDTGAVRIVAGDGATGPGDSQKLQNPYGLAIDQTGHLLIANKSKNCIDRLSNRLDPLATVDATGERKNRFIGTINYPMGPSSVNVCRNGNVLVAYSVDGTIYRIDSYGHLARVVGALPSANVAIKPLRNIPPADVATAALYHPAFAIESPDGLIYFTERGHQVVRVYQPSTGIRSLFAPSAAIDALYLTRPSPVTLDMAHYHSAYPTSIAFDATCALYLADILQQCIWQVDLAAGSVRQIMKSNLRDPSIKGGPAAMTFGPDNTLWVLDHGEGMVIGYVKSAQGWRRVAASCSTNYAAVKCQVTESAGIVCGR